MCAHKLMIAQLQLYDESRSFQSRSVLHFSFKFLCIAPMYHHELLLLSAVKLSSKVACQGSVFVMKYEGLIHDSVDVAVYNGK